jgi:hypothetical protein
LVADAGADIMRYKGIGPLSKWVDDHLFIRIRREQTNSYNESRRAWKERIVTQGGCHHDGGRLWYRGHTLPDNQIEEFDEDMLPPIRNLPPHPKASSDDARYSYSIHDIDDVSNELGIPWELSKDEPFDVEVPFTGLRWHLDRKTVALGKNKATKYLAAICAFHSKKTHTLQEVRQLYGKLLHACLVIPVGCAYLTSLEAFLGIFHDSPLKPRTQPSGTEDDLAWWATTLSEPSLSRPIPAVCEIRDLHAYSDASSSIGIGIVIGDHWRAWRLLPGWKAQLRDIGWAEAVGFEFLIHTIINAGAKNADIKVWGDNNGVVEGWWKGRSRNKPSNEVFHRIHHLSQASNCLFHTRYVASAFNPADNPSRGIYSSLQLLLPPFEIPHELRSFLVDFDHPPLPAELSLLATRQRQSPLPKIHPSPADQQSAALRFKCEQQQQEAILASRPWRNL